MNEENVSVIESTAGAEGWSKVVAWPIDAVEAVCLLVLRAEIATEIETRIEFPRLMTFDGSREVGPRRWLVRGRRSERKPCGRDEDRRVQMAFGGVERCGGEMVHHDHFLVHLS